MIDVTMKELPAAKLHIREFEPADEPAVAGLWHECGLAHAGNDPHEDILRKSRVAPELFLVGTIDGHVVATVMAGYEGHRGWINYLGVQAELRKQGVGRRMMQAAEDRLQALGCPKINLLVRCSNRAVQGFYERLGFCCEEVIFMGKRLS
jgi:ribosomal protein S18 acetylase RimI-like enzyme